MPSQLWSLKVQDVLHGLIQSVVVAVLTAVLTALQHGGSIDWKTVLMSGIVAGLSFVLQRFGTSPEGKVLGKV